MSYLQSAVGGDLVVREVVVVVSGIDWERSEDSTSLIDLFNSNEAVPLFLLICKENIEMVFDWHSHTS